MNCDRIARWYRWLEYFSFGRALERIRFQYLPAAANSQRVLMLGEGDGRFIARYVESYRQSVVDSIESSSEMMRLAEGRVGRVTAAERRVTFHHADARSFPLAEGAYDLVVTHFFLDCFSTEESAAIISRISLAATPRARWLVSEFHEPENGFARLWTKPLIRLCYFFFRLTTGLKTNHLPDYRGALQAHGFERLSYHTARGGLLISELWERNLTPLPKASRDLLN